MKKDNGNYLLKYLRNPTKYLAFILLVFTTFFVAASGCRSGERISLDVEQQFGAETIQKEVVAKISRLVLGNIEVTGRFRMIKEKGVLRAALPPANPGFQDIDPEFGVPRGFHPALINEIALILDVKPNITLLDMAPAPPDIPPDWERDYDIIILPEGRGGCGAGKGAKFFFTGPESGWKTLCVAGEGEALILAVKEILSYLNESGIFARLHKNYVNP